MKFAIAICLVAASVAFAQVEDRVVAILRDDRTDDSAGNFKYAFAADNGIEMDVSGSPSGAGPVNMQGYYVVPLENGEVARVEFVANENGFQPTADILPTPHPIPEHVQELFRIAEQQRAEGVAFDNQGFRV